MIKTILNTMRPIERKVVNQSWTFENGAMVDLVHMKNSWHITVFFVGSNRSTNHTFPGYTQAMSFVRSIAHMDMRGSDHNVVRAECRFKP